MVSAPFLGMSFVIELDMHEWYLILYYIIHTGPNAYMV